MPEWGLITGYDDEAQIFYALAVNAAQSDPTSPAYDGSQMPYNVLVKREIPLLSVLTITDLSDKSQSDILKDTLKLAADHLQGKEWCDNAKGLDAYPALIKHFEADFDPAASWNMEYFLGTFGALKYYAWKYFEKTKQRQLALVYKAVYDAWLKAFQIKTGEDIIQPAVREKIASLLKSAHKNETHAMEMMNEMWLEDK